MTRERQGTAKEAKTITIVSPNYANSDAEAMLLRTQDGEGTIYIYIYIYRYISVSTHGLELIQAPMCVQKVPDSQILKNMYIKSRIYRVYDITPYLSIGNCPIGVERADRSLLFLHFS